MFDLRPGLARPADLTDRIREFVSALRDHAHSMGMWLWAAYGSSLVLCSVLVAARVHGGIGIGEWTRDPLAAAAFRWRHAAPGTTPDLPAYLGAVSQIGVVLWSIAFAASVLAAMVMAKRKRERLGGGSDAQFFGHAAWVTLICVLDDALMLHDDVLPRYLGVTEVWVHLVIAAGFLSYLWRWRQRIARTEFLPLFVAVLGFSMSVGIDVIIAPSSGAFALVDGAKFIGIVSWCTYQLRVAWRAL
ncbi:MAG: hypothetical protein AAF488_04405 [Planctomycetota bacterium]